MSSTAAIYLAHLNPMTKAHESIILTLKQNYRVNVYRFNPLNAARLEISASSVKEKLYRQATEGIGDNEWRNKVPAPVVEIIKRNWDVVDKFARMEDNTMRVMGMKFPKEGYK